eukprot:303693_1
MDDSWEETFISKLSLPEIKQLLITRDGATKNMKKAEMINNLKLNHCVVLDENKIKNQLTCKQLLIELKLNGLSQQTAKKTALISRLLNRETLLKKTWKFQNSIITNSQSEPQIRNIIALNQSEFIVMTVDTIYKYNIHQHAWEKLSTFPSEYRIRVDYNWICATADFDHKNQILFILANGQYLMKYDLKTSKWTVNDVKDPEEPVREGRCNVMMPQTVFCRYANCIFVKNKFHVFGGLQNENHLIWNEKKKTFIINDCDGFPGRKLWPVIIYIKSKQSLWLFGGRRGETKMYSYSFGNNKWNTMSVELPEAYRACAYTLCIGERYLVLIVETILYLLDLVSYKWRECNIPCPFDVTHAICMCNVMKETLLSFGYIRELCKTQSLKFPPYYLVELCKSFYVEEYLYVKNQEDHCKINFEGIIKNSVELNYDIIAERRVKYKMF